MELDSTTESAKFGLNCGGGILWRGGSWAPGNAYTKDILVQNTTNQMQRFKYKIPTTKFFSMDFPKEVKLGPGIVHHIPVTFRPIRLEEYDDFVEIVAAGGSFRVPIRSRVAKVSIILPEEAEIAPTPVNETNSVEIALVNSGQLDARFQFQFPPPFRFEPESGTVPVGSQLAITVFFSPTASNLIHGQACCRVQDGGGEHFIQLKAYGRFPSIQSEEETVDFSDQNIPETGHFVERIVELRNPSNVRATFDICRQDSDIPSAFGFPFLKGVIPPLGTLLLPVRYFPVTVGLTSVEYYDLTTPSGLSLTLTLKGKAIGPDVSVVNSQKIRTIPFVEFPDVFISSGDGSSSGGQNRDPSSSSRAVTLYNDSPVSAFFHIQVESSGCFQTLNSNGVIQPKLCSTVHFTFKPKYAGNYHRKVFIFLENQAPIFVDLIGTAYSETSRPPALHYKHIATFRRRRRMGLSRCSPPELEELLASDLEKKKQLLFGKEPELEEWNSRLSRSGDLLNSQVALLSEVFDPQTADTCDMSLNQRVIDFGGVSRSKGLSKRSLSYTNRTHSKVFVRWMSPETSDSDGFQTVPEFTVYPEEVEIKPGETFSFDVLFRPGRDNFYYCREIEAYVTYKINRNFRLVNEESLTPPWFLSFRAIAHTFLPSIEHFIPRLDGGHLRTDISFPSCHLGDTVYQSAKLLNDGDTPFAFAFRSSSLLEFDVYPKCGLVGSNQFCVLYFSFHPSEEKFFRSQLLCLINETEASSVHFTLSGSGCLPNLMPSEDSLLFFKPTSLGLSTKQQYTLSNKSRIPLIYSIEVPPRLAETIIPDHSEGVILGNDSVDVRFSFRPGSVGKLETIIECHYSNMYYEDEFSKTAEIIVKGEGIQGALVFDPPKLDVGPEIIGETKKKKFFLINKSDSPLFFDLSITDNSEPDDFQQQEIARLLSGDDKRVLAILPKSSGLIEARSKLSFELSFTPLVQKPYQFKLFWHVRRSLDEEGPKDSSEAGGPGAGDSSESFSFGIEQLDEYCCSIVGEGTFPSLLWEDIRCKTIPSSRLWSQWHLYDINVELTSRMELADVFNNKSYSLDNKYQEFEILFDPAPIGSPDCLVYVRLKNNGSVPLTFQFRFPNESGIELENWVEPGELSGREREIEILLDKKLFGISPLQTTLNPGEGTIVQFRYSYLYLEYNGNHRLDILLKINDGKQVKLLLHGRTLDQSEPFLHVERNIWKLRSVPLGSPSAFHQSFNLYNPSAVELEYSIDPNIIAEFNHSNYDFAVLTLPDPSGVLPPHGSTALILAFHPLECKTYSLTLPIQWRVHDDTLTLGNDPQLLELSILGDGYLPESPPQLTDGQRQWSFPPPAPAFVSPWSLLRISTDQFRLGSVARGSIVRRMLFLENANQSDAIHFRWDTSSVIISPDLIQVDPAEGIVYPGKSLSLELELRCDHSIGSFSHVIFLRCDRLSSCPPSAPFVPEKRIPVAENMTENFFNRQDEYLRENTCRSQRLTKKLSTLKKDIIDTTIWRPANSTSQGTSESIPVCLDYEVIDPLFLSEISENNEPLLRYFNTALHHAVAAEAREDPSAEKPYSSVFGDLLPAPSSVFPPLPFLCLQLLSSAQGAPSPTDRPDSAPTSTTVLCNPDFQSALTDIFDDTLQHIVREVRNGSFRITEKPKTYMKLE